MKSNEMYGISRIDDISHRAHAWRVSIRRRSRPFVKNFTDLQFGGSEKALIEAKKYRDQLLIKQPPMSRRENCEVKRRNNKSGIPGVCKYGKPYRLKDGTLKKIWYWEANWPDENGKNLSLAFPVKKYGEKGAFNLAVEARTNGLSTVEGPFWSSAPGEIKQIGER